MPGSRNTDDSLKKQAPTNRSGAKKDRKRWCKGRAGVEHVWQIEKPSNHPGWQTRSCQWNIWPRKQYWHCIHRCICQNCGRQEPIAKEQCPDWKANA